MIGLDDIWAVVTETRDTVKGLESKLDNVSDTSKDHESRIRALEKVIWKAAGFACAIGAAGGWGLDHLFG
jgi:hypothetical protein